MAPCRRGIGDIAAPAARRKAGSTVAREHGTRLGDQGAPQRARGGPRRVSPRHHCARHCQRDHQHSLSHRLALHAGDLRPGAAEPQCADADRSVDPRHRALRLSGASRPAARPRAGPHRPLARSEPERPGLSARSRSSRCEPARQSDGLQPLRDLDQIRNFLSSPGPLAFLDLPWMPFYIGICFIFHFWLGVAALIGRHHPDQLHDLHRDVHPRSRRRRRPNLPRGAMRWPRPRAATPRCSRPWG